MKAGSPLQARLEEAGHFTRMASRVVRSVGAGPELLCFFVTSRCDASCVHCFDWRRRGPEVEAADLSSEELLKIAKKLPRLYFLLLTGGEPFLRDDLPEIAAAMASTAKPRVVGIPTNGGRPDAILASTRRLLEKLPNNVQLSINVSLDGVGPLHDRIRGVEGIFDRAVETLKRLRALSQEHSNLGVGVVSVVSHHNQDHLSELMHFVLDDLDIPVWAPFLARGTPRDPGSLDVDIERYVEAARELGVRILDGSYKEYGGFGGALLNNAKNVIRREVIHETVVEGRRVVPCLAGRHSAVVWSNGDVHPCELMDRSMGSLRDFDYDLSALWRSDGANAARRCVDDAPCACTHENTLTTSVAFDWHQWPWLLSWALAFARRRPRTPDAAQPPDSEGADSVPAGPDTELTCYVPAFNEERGIASTVRILDRVLQKLAHGHEIIVVDDGSSDGTCARVEALDNPRVRCLRYEDGPSFRGNLSRSLLSTDSPFVMFMDGDLTANEKDMSRTLGALRSGVDVVAGSRYHPESHVVRHPSRLAFSLAYNATVRGIVGTSFRDHQCGLKGFQRSVLEAVLPKLGGREAERGWFWDAEVLARAEHDGFRVEEIPVTWACRLDSRSMLTKQYRLLPWLFKLGRELRR